MPGRSGVNVNRSSAYKRVSGEEITGGDRQGALAAADNVLSFPSCRSDSDFCLEGITATHHILLLLPCTALVRGSGLCHKTVFWLSLSLLKDKERGLQKAIKITAEKDKNMP